MTLKAECGMTNGFPDQVHVLTLERPNSRNALVCELINRATGEWNMEKINNRFLPEDREQ